MKKPVVYAHRGASGYALENTIPSFLLAIQMQADAVEFDVQLTSDGEVAVFHDFTLTRLFEVDKDVAGLTAGELKQYAFRDDPGGTTVRIPLLDELLPAIGHRIGMNIELKSQSGDRSELRLLCGRVLELVKKYDLMKDIIVSSFSIGALSQMRELSDTVKIALLTDDTGILNSAHNGAGHGLDFYLKTAHGLGADALNAAYLLVDKNILSAIHGSGLRVNTFTVNDRDLMRQQVILGVDGFFTNYPDVALDVIRRETDRGAGA